MSFRLDDLNSVGESYTENYFRQLVVAIEATPVTIMNRLSLARRTQVINCLVEGNSIRLTERMTDTHRDTIMRLGVEVGTGCAALADQQMRSHLPSHSMR